MAKYSIDDVLTWEIQEEVIRKFCVEFYEFAEEDDVKEACKVILRFCATPGEDYGGILD